MAVYYVDTASSGGNGTTTATSGANAAWATIASVNAASFSAGDSILFKRGCTWRETLTIPSSGSAGNPITFGQYGTTGADPIIDGSNVFSSWTQEVVAGGGVLTDSLDVTTQALNIFNAAGRAYASNKFTAGSNYNLGRIDVNLTKVSSPTMVITCYLYSDNATKPGNVLATSTNTITASAIVDGTYHEFDFDGTCALTATTVYHVVLGANGTSGTNYVTWGGQSWGGDADQSTDGASWGDVVNWYPSFKTYTPVTAGMTIYYAADTVVPNVAWEDGTALLKVQTKAALVAGSWWYDDPNDRLYVRTTGDDDPAGYVITAGYRDYGINTNGRDYLVIDDITVCYTNKYGVISYVGSDTVTIQDCELYQNGFGIDVLGTNTTITGCNIHDGHIIVDDAAAGNDYGAVGINIESSDVEISYCTFSNLFAPCTDFGEDGGGIEIFQYDNAVVEDISVHHCSFTNASGLLEATCGNVGTIQNVSFYYNIVLENRAAPDSIIAVHNGGSYPGTISNITFYNNVIVSTGTGTGNEVFWMTSSPGAGVLTLKNNIVYASNITAASTITPSTHTNNYYYNPGDASWTIGFTLGTGEVRGDPKLVNAASDFRLQADSPCLDAGVDVGLTTDYAGNPVGANPDIGAYEKLFSSFGGGIRMTIGLGLG